VRGDAIAVFQETRALCDHFDLNPLGLIASGAFLIMTSEREADGVLARVVEAGIPAAVIGEITEKHRGIKVLTAQGMEDLPLYEQDELTKIVEAKAS